MKENDYRFGNFVCQLREEKGMTQAELAEMLGVTPAAVSKWENGESKPRTEKLFELAKILGVTAEELMNSERKPPTPDHQSDDHTSSHALPPNDTRFRRIGAFFLDELFCQTTGIIVFVILFAVFRQKTNILVYFTVSVSGISMLLMIFRDFIINGRSLGKRITRMTIANTADGSRPK